MKLLVVICIGALTFGAFAGEMVVRLKDGSEVRFDMEKVDKVLFDIANETTSSSLSTNGNCIDGTCCSDSESIVDTTADSTTPTVEDMKKLGELAAKGNRDDIDEFINTAEELYENIDYDNEKVRSREILSLIRAAFKPIAEMAGRGESSALEALKQINISQDLRGLTCEAYGIAAAMGNKESLDVLLKYHRHGFILSSSVIALKEAANKNIPEAVDFLAAIVNDPKNRSLRHVASEGLIGAAIVGNEKAIEALDALAKED